LNASSGKHHQGKTYFLVFLRQTAGSNLENMCDFTQNVKYIFTKGLEDIQNRKIQNLRVPPISTVRLKNLHILGRDLSFRLISTHGSPQAVNWYAVKWSISAVRRLGLTAPLANGLRPVEFWCAAHRSPPLIVKCARVCMKKAKKSVCACGGEWQNKRAEAAIFLHMCCHRLVAWSLSVIYTFAFFQYHFGPRAGTAGPTLLLACGKNHLSICVREKESGGRTRGRKGAAGRLHE
jgi:hypothetical protein